MSSQKRLYPNYHSDMVLKARLELSVDIPSFNVSLSHCILRAAQQLASRLVNRLSDRPMTAGSISDSHALMYDMTVNRIVMYTLGYNFAGGDLVPLKQFGSKRPTSTHAGTQMTPEQNILKRLKHF